MYTWGSELINKVLCLNIYMQSANTMTNDDNAVLNVYNIEAIREILREY